MTDTITYDDFQKVDVRCGEIVEVQDFPRARNPSYKVRVYFGEEIGYRWSAAQITSYDRDALIGQQVVAVVNFAPKNIAGFLSECLILGVPTAEGIVSLLQPSKKAVVGSRMF
jgi:tRNA-binding protein